jgi:hypothetical protein
VAGVAPLLVISVAIIAVAFAAAAIAWAEVMLALIKRLPEADSDQQIRRSDGLLRRRRSRGR